MLTEADLQDIVDAKRDVPLADAVILWNEPAVVERDWPLGVLVLPQSPPMDCKRTRHLYGLVMDRFMNSRENCMHSWMVGDTNARLAELREIVDNMVKDGVPKEMVDKDLAVIPEWRHAH